MTSHPLPADDPAVKELTAFIETQAIDKSNARWRLGLKKPPQVKFDAKKKYRWNLKTNHGVIAIDLMPDVAPMHVSSTMFLAMIGFYDALQFHRVIPGFMAQGGCPLGSGTGGPGYQYSGEFGKPKHDQPGMLSMANAGPGTDGSQFFLTFVPTPWLDGKHTLFGKIVDGMKVLGELEKRGSSPAGRPLEKLMLEQSWISIH